MIYGNKHKIHTCTKMNRKHSEMGQWDKTQSRELLGLFICVCIALCTIAAHNTAQNRPDLSHTLQPITIAPMMPIWGTGAGVCHMYNNFFCILNPFQIFFPILIKIFLTPYFPPLEYTVYLDCVFWLDSTLKQGTGESRLLCVHDLAAPRESSWVIHCICLCPIL